MGFFTGLLQKSVFFGQIEWKSLFAVSEDGVLGLVYERGLRQGSVRAEAKR